MSREFQDWMEKMARLDYIKPDEIPKIDLYMDQVTTFMETQLAGTKRTPEDKIMTKTMINNYTKNKLLPPPERKKYSKDHMLLRAHVVGVDPRLERQGSAGKTGSSGTN